mmetsp:Transcript_65027/g.127878  ORF Transcript_65027/g.127878 Transcript_65027/m.127878 type:complete len:471 (-) Transcript_65027:45-1457(-)
MAGDPVARALQSLDQFRQVSRDLTRGTLTGGIFTAIAYALLLLLLIAELGAFLRTTYVTNVVMDQNTEELLQINFDITVLDLPCKYLQVGVWDKFGQQQMNSTDQFAYIPIDHRGMVKGMGYSKDEITALESADAATDVSEEEKKELEADWSSTSDHFKHNDFNAAVTFHDFTLVNFFAEWCVHCRKFHPMWNEAAERISDKLSFTNADGQEATVKFMKMNCVDFTTVCQQAQIAAFPTLRLYKRDGSFEAYHSKRSVENIIAFLTASIRNSHLIIARHHTMFSEGCQVHGTMQVPRVPGHFHLVAAPFGDMTVNPAITNVSHIVNHLSFGPRPTRATRSTVPAELMANVNPLDGRKFIVERFHEAPQHYLKVVSTHVEGMRTPLYQMTHTDRVRKLKKDGGDINRAPQARFVYDLSPMSIVVKTKSKRWYEFLTSLFAILGGAFTVVELTSGAVETVGTAVKEALGKTN